MPPPENRLPIAIRAGEKLRLTCTAVVFDFDGVLADTERVHLAVTQDVYRDRGWALSEADYFAEYLGYDDAELLKRFAADRGIVIDDDGIKAIVDEKFDRFHERLAGGDALYPGTRACIARIRERFRSRSRPARSTPTSSRFCAPAVSPASFRSSSGSTTSSTASRRRIRTEGGDAAGRAAGRSRRGQEIRAGESRRRVRLGCGQLA